jgi:hypothetical protein
MVETQFGITVRNSRKQRLNVYLEPWGERYVLKPDETLRIQAQGPAEPSSNAALEIHSGEDSVTLWGWSGSSVRVSQ